MHTMTMPGNLYRALQNRDAFHNPAPEDQAALVVFKAAHAKRMGVGVRFHLTSDEETLNYICDYIDSLAGLVRHGMLPSRELGVTVGTLEWVARQTLTPVPT